MPEPMAPDSSTAEGVVRAIYDRVSRGDFAGVLQLLAPDVVFVQADSLPFGGHYTGHAGFSAMAARIVAAWPGFGVQPGAFLSDGADHVVVMTRLSGRHLDMPMLELWTVRHGLVRRCQPFYFDTAAAAKSAVP